MSKYFHMCDMCGKDFADYFKTTHFCSRDCYYKYKDVNRKTKKVICPICNNSFRQKRPEQIFCSNECKVKSFENKIDCNCDYCGKEFHRIPSEVNKHKNHYCSLECKENAMFWSFEDTEILKENFSKMSYKEMTNIFSQPKTVEAIKRRARYIGITSSREWTREEIEILINNYSKISMEEVQKLLPNRTKSSILGQARVQNIKSFHYLNNIYSEKEDDYIKENYLTKSNEEIGRVLNRSANGIAQHLWVLGLHRPAETSNYIDLSRYIRARLTPWRDKVRQNNNYTCALTGKRSNIIVHHIHGFNLIFAETIDVLNFQIRQNMSEYTQQQLDEFFETFLLIQESYNSYICISEDVHKQFHNIYGYGNNTIEQWNEFVNTYYK